MSSSQLIVLDSTDVYNNQNPNINGSYDDFIVTFNRPINLGNKNYELALINLFTFYTWPIISNNNQNNRFDIIRASPSKTVQCTLPDGIYSINTLNDFIYSILQSEFSYTGNEFQMPILLVANLAISRFIIEINDLNFSINIGINNFYKLLGWASIDNKLIVSTTTGSQVGNINYNIDCYHINCDIVNSSIVNNDNYRSVIYTFVPNIEIGSIISIEPITKIYQPINREEMITSIRIYLTDNKMRKVYLNEPLVIVLHLQEIK